MQDYIVKISTNIVYIKDFLLKLILWIYFTNLENEKNTLNI